MRGAQSTGALLAGWLLLGCVSLVMAADKAAGLSDDFLEYLGSLEGDEESWQDFAADAAADRKPVAAQASSSSSASATSKATASMGKADK